MQVCDRTVCIACTLSASSVLCRCVYGIVCVWSALGWSHKHSLQRCAMSLHNFALSMLLDLNFILTVVCRERVLPLLLGSVLPAAGALSRWLEALAQQADRPEQLWVLESLHVSAHLSRLCSVCSGIVDLQMRRVHETCSNLFPSHTPAKPLSLPHLCRTLCKP